MAPVAYFRHPSSLEHDTGMHPERAERILAIEAELGRRGWAGLERFEAPRVPHSALLAVHPREHVRAVEAMSLRGGGAFDPDTVASEGSYEAAIHAAGGAVAMVDRLLDSPDGRPGAGFCGLRPPGHHAEPARAMGFCLFDNVAVAARRARDEHGIERVLILDWDVHHGNGTAAIFAGSDDVLFVSIHQWPLYPGTGAASEVGTGAGEGFTVNLPVPPGSGDEVFVSHVEHLALPLAREWRPGLVLVSAGYDAHRDDPLADCRVTDGGYVAMARLVRAVADELGAPVGVVLEGGYELGALARSVAGTLEALGDDGEAGAEADGAAAAAAAAPGGRGGVPVHPLTVEARERVAAHWPALGDAAPSRRGGESA
jgi:acetoin utilization deacetylase AcuC-like enzyme